MHDMHIAARRALTRLQRLLDNIGNWYFRTGGTTVRLPNGQLRHYGPSPTGSVVHFRDWPTLRSFLFGLAPSLAFVEGFASGSITVTSDQGETDEQALSLLLQTVFANSRGNRRLTQLFALRPRPGNMSRQDQASNIGYHYEGAAADLVRATQAWYRLLLGEEMAYTCARYTTGQEDLAEAQHDKFMDIALKLGLTVPRTNEEYQSNSAIQLLDVGCGWGYGACFMAHEFGVRVVGITISREQLDTAHRLAQTMGVAHLVQFKLINALDLAEYVGEGKRFPELFDAAYTIGMMEHIHRRQYQAVFEMLATVTKPHARILVHCITNQHGGLPDPMIRLIFPGSRLRSLYQLLREAAGTPLFCVDVENIWQHYARTCEQWVNNHIANREEIIDLLGSRHYLLNLIWLLGSVEYFKTGPLSLSQVLFINGKPPYSRFPWDRRYLYNGAGNHQAEVAEAV